MQKTAFSSRRCPTIVAPVESITLLETSLVTTTKRSGVLPFERPASVRRGRQPFFQLKLIQLGSAGYLVVVVRFRRSRHRWRDDVMSFSLRMLTCSGQCECRRPFSMIHMSSWKMVKVDHVERKVNYNLMTLLTDNSISSCFLFVSKHDKQSSYTLLFKNKISVFQALLPLID